jgi:hypothetical protein
MKKRPLCISIGHTADSTSKELAGNHDSFTGFKYDKPRITSSERVNATSVEPSITSLALLTSLYVTR